MLLYRRAEEINVEVDDAFEVVASSLPKCS